MQRNELVALLRTLSTWSVRLGHFARFSGDVSTSRWTKENSQKVLRAGQNNPYELLRDLQAEQFGHSCPVPLK
jgi:hypothetical protein